MASGTASGFQTPVGAGGRSMTPSMRANGGGGDAAMGRTLSTMGVGAMVRRRFPRDGAALAQTLDLVRQTPPAAWGGGPSLT